MKRPPNIDRKLLFLNSGFSLPLIHLFPAAFPARYSRAQVQDQNVVLDKREREAQSAADVDTVLA